MTLSASPDILDATTYPFQRLRYMFQHMTPQEGVTGELSGLDYATLQRGAGANMSVDTSAGSGWIKGDTGTRQGMYHLVNDATINLVVGAAHATLPRIDQVILRIFDASVSGASNTPTLSVLAGTATSGATLDNRTGAAALPNDAIRLCDILVDPAVGSIVNAKIRDRRPWCRGVSHAFLSSGADLTTTSAVLASVGFNNRYECSGAPVDMGLSGVLKHDTAGATTFLSPAIDGTAQISMRRIPSGASEEDFFSVRARVLPSAGSHILGWYWATSTGTATLVRTASPLSVWVEEIAKQNVSNG